MSKEAEAARGVGFLDLLTLVLIALKLAGFIDWSWWAVLAPPAYPLAIMAVLYVSAALVAYANERP